MGKIEKRKDNGITLVALVITIVLNCSFFAMERILKKEEILKRRKISIII